MSERITNATFARSAARLAKVCAGWAGDTLDLTPSDGDTSHDAVQRFIDEVRARLDYLEDALRAAPPYRDPETKITTLKVKLSLELPPIPDHLVSSQGQRYPLSAVKESELRYIGRKIGEAMIEKSKGGQSCQKP